MPTYNEEASIAHAVTEVREHVFAAEPLAELIVVDDGSTDRTPRILEELKDQDPRIRVIRQLNEGHGAALIAGLEEARGDRILLLDSDAQIALDRFGDIQNASLHHDGFFGVRTIRHDPAFRRLVSMAMRALIRFAFRVDLPDGGAPFKLITAQLLQRVRPTIGAKPHIPSVLIAICALRLGYDVLQQPIEHRARAHGISNLRHWRLVALSWHAVGDLIHLRRNLKAEM